MSPLDVGLAHYRQRQRVSRRLRREAQGLWRQINRDSITASWRVLLPRLLVLMEAAQREVVEPADAYLTAVLTAQGIDPVASGAVVTSQLVGVSAQGGSLPGLLDQPRVVTMTALSEGATATQALRTGWVGLEMILATQVADTGRAADQVAMAARRRAGGYVRQIVGRTCSRCVILAGKWFRYNQGFQRHPRCDCIHIPSREDVAGDLATDPKAYFNSLSKTEQDKTFGRAGAESIRLGADMNQVVNARKGVRTATFGKRKVLVTSEGTTKRGLFGGYEIRPDGSLRKRTDSELVKKPGERVRRARQLRLMPEEILAQAQTRDEALTLLRQYGYLR